MVVVAPTPASAAPKVLLLSSGKPPAPGAAPTLPLMLPPSPEATSGAPGPGPGQSPARKRQRLTHLSPEEKALRRKLKNRVAAQTARDRKKARMSELEQQVVDLEEENQKLLIENQLLRERTHGLVIENQELRQRLGMDALMPEEEETESKVNDVRAVAGSAERSTQTMCASAAGAGPAVTLPEHVPVDSDGLDSSDSESDILLGILDNLDPDMFFRYVTAEGGLEEPREVGAAQEPSSVPASPSPLVGPPSAKLEAINELIRFDHVYTKPLVLELPSEADGPGGSVVVKIEEVPLSPSLKPEPPEPLTVAVKEELLDEDLIPELGMENLLCSSHGLKASPYLLDACSDSGYEGSPSPFNELSSPLGAGPSWEDTFANELFPQLISV
ncbi:LOW QUALITY PROTEIN: X-box-binding protein 1 [Monodelphis domestica]|uniref:LOW QUALITY PROTEIN: X-box-binding protein 1 n=1 Tax=Monodelphis domestica TaxID=13616 RepID=UPI0024E1AAF6|nr:LOW QUALITY PROTEIN: X-box-binding protein 1 [Monodelphis domestica]